MAAFLGVAPASEALAQVVHRVLVDKTRLHQQSSAVDVALTAPRTPCDGSCPYAFSARVSGQNLGGIAVPVLSGPVDTASLGALWNNGRLTFNPDGEWRLGPGEIQARTQGELDALFGSGAYSMVVTGVTVPLNLVGDGYPAPAVMTLSGGAWSGGQYVVHPSQAVTITTNAFPGFGSHPDNKAYVYGFARDGSGSLPGSTGTNVATLSIPANTLVAGKEYEAVAVFEAYVSTNAAIAGSVNGAKYNSRTSVFIRADASAPASSTPTPVFPLTVNANIGPTVSSATASLQYRPQDVGSTGSVYVFAVAPATQVQGAAQAKAAQLPFTAKSAAKDDVPIQCVLAQLNASGQLQAVSAANLQAFVTGVLASSGQAVTILNGVATVNIAGATFYVGYGPNAITMYNSGVNRSALTVPGSVQCKPEAPKTGWWWNPLEDGRGFSIEVVANRYFFAGFLYDVSGRATWLVASGEGATLDGSLITGSLLEARGGQTLGGAYRSPTVSKVGDITLAFNDSSHGTIVWPGGTVPIRRFDIVPNGLTLPALPSQPQSGWWWNPAESGRGFFLEWQGDRLNIAGYLYDDAGNPIWYLTQNLSPSTDLRQFASNWWQFGNGMTLAGPWKPHQQVNGNVAPVTIRFDDAENATMTLPNGRTTALRRHRF